MSARRGLEGSQVSWRPASSIVCSSLTQHVWHGSRNVCSTTTHCLSAREPNISKRASSTPPVVGEGVTLDPITGAVPQKALSPSLKTSVDVSSLLHRGLTLRSGPAARGATAHTTKALFLPPRGRNFVIAGCDQSRVGWLCFLRIPGFQHKAFCHLRRATNLSHVISRNLTDYVRPSSLWLTVGPASLPARR